MSGNNYSYYEPEDENFRKVGNIYSDYFTWASAGDGEPRIEFEEPEGNLLPTEDETPLENWIVRSKNPTEDTTDELVFAFSFFNEVFFQNELPACLITLQRKRNVAGYYAPKRFINEDGDLTGEIALNPAMFEKRFLPEALSTLLHEMCHHWQHHFGEPGRRGYHNREWANKMESFDLMPSHTGFPGGRRTGESMSDYILPGGWFDRVTRFLIEKGFTITWCDRETTERTDGEVVSGGEAEEPVATGSKGNSRPKFTCPVCGQNAWAKPSAKLLCGHCHKPMAAQTVRPESRTINLKSRS